MSQDPLRSLIYQVSSVPHWDLLNLRRRLLIEGLKPPGFILGDARFILELFVNTVREGDAVSAGRLVPLLFRRPEGVPCLLFAWELVKCVVEIHPQADFSFLLNFFENFLFDTPTGSACQLAVMDYCSILLHQKQYGKVRNTILRAVNRPTPGEKNPRETGRFRRFYSLLQAWAFYGALHAETKSVSDTEGLVDFADFEDPEQLAISAADHFESVISFRGSWESLLPPLTETLTLLKREDEIGSFLKHSLNSEQLGSRGVKIARQWLSMNDPDRLLSDYWEKLRCTERRLCLENSELLESLLRNADEMKQLPLEDRLEMTLVLLDTPGYHSLEFVWELLVQQLEEMASLEAEACSSGFQQLLTHVVLGDWNIFHFRDVRAKETDFLVLHKALVSVAVFGGSPYCEAVESRTDSITSEWRALSKVIASLNRRFNRWRKKTEQSFDEATLTEHSVDGKRRRRSTAKSSISSCDISLDKKQPFKRRKNSHHVKACQIKNVSDV